MKTAFLTAVVAFGLSFLALTYRNQLGIAEPMDSLTNFGSMLGICEPKITFDWPPKLNEPYCDLGPAYVNNPG